MLVLGIPQVFEKKLQELQDLAKTISDPEMKTKMVAVANTALDAIDNQLNASKPEW